MDLCAIYRLAQHGFGKLQIRDPCADSRPGAHQRYECCAVNLAEQEECEMPSFVCRQHGFLMVEVLFATVVAALALLSIAGLFIQSLQANTSASGYTVATNLAQEKLELLSVIDAATLTSATFSDETITLNSVLYTRHTTTAVRSDLDATNKLIQVTVTISWTEAVNLIACRCRLILSVRHFRNIREGG